MLEALFFKNYYKAKVNIALLDVLFPDKKIFLFVYFSW